MAHNHAHDHSHTSNKKILIISFFIISAYMVVEAIGGYLTNSLALLADAGHMLSDAASLAIALLAFKLGEQIANNRKTFGYRRFEILAAVLNGVTLILISIYIFYEAINRFIQPPEVASVGMLIVSSIGLAINLLVGWIMLRGADVEHNLNMRGAYLHVVSDTLGSVGAILAALLIMAFGWNWADPLAGIIVSGLVLRSGYFVTKSGLNVLMEGAPQNVDVEKVLQVIHNKEGVRSIHDFHLWSITSGMNALSCHVVVDGNLQIYDSENLLQEIEHDLAHLNVQHSTIQFETLSHPHSDELLCKLKVGEVVHQH
ncbi:MULTISPECIES: cation diffusion facilitator family transporter [Exiguobacterium]|uniref:cation diffusion facilitator family transporter n=1 Tax=Exiguobacterium TaxID=33986 RepID=UPI001BEB3184|nr:MULTISPECIES: cation diffusion facilitator family transporter [unclassified Exiguobacterium]